MPLNADISGQTKFIKDKETICLTEDQAGVCKKVETGKVVNIDTIKQEIKEDIDRMDNTNGEINPYHEITVNKTEGDNTIILQMEQWSILSNVINYIQYDKLPRNFYKLDIKAVDQKSHKKIYNKEEERQVLQLDFRYMPDKLKEFLCSLIILLYKNT